jgi:hypothetical protein
MAMRRATMGLVLSVAAMATIMSALGALVATRTISNNGNIMINSVVQLGVYADNACTTTLSSVSWGTLSPGNTSTATLYLRNEGNIPVTLNMQISNWNPASASTYFTLTWNRANYVLAVNQTVQAVLTLAVSSGINGITSFSFDITITATQ